MAHCELCIKSCLFFEENPITQKEINLTFCDADDWFICDVYYVIMHAITSQLILKPNTKHVSTTMHIKTGVMLDNSNLCRCLGHLNMHLYICHYEIYGLQTEQNVQHKIYGQTIIIYQIHRKTPLFPRLSIAI